MTKTVLITGAGIGIGKATSFAFARAGFHVAVTDVLRADGLSGPGYRAAPCGWCAGRFATHCR